MYGDCNANAPSTGTWLRLNQVFDQITRQVGNLDAATARICRILRERPWRGESFDGTEKFTSATMEASIWAWAEFDMPNCAATFDLANHDLRVEGGTCSRPGDVTTALGLRAMQSGIVCIEIFVAGASTKHDAPTAAKGKLPSPTENVLHTFVADFIAEVERLGEKPKQGRCWQVACNGWATAKKEKWPDTKKNSLISGIPGATRKRVFVEFEKQHHVTRGRPRKSPE